MLDLFKKKPQDRQDWNKRGDQVYAIIPAAGSSSRMGGGNKLVMELGGQPILCRTLCVFNACDVIDGIVLVCRRQDQKTYAALCADWNIDKVVKIVEGGPSREHSVLNGVLACGREIGYVAIHDAARPLITEDIIREAVETARRDSAAAPAVGVKDSIQRIQRGKMMENVDRETIVAVQTPQCFDIDLIRAALTKAIESGAALTDDCGAVTALGQPVSMTRGSYENIKITTPEDVALGEVILKGRARCL
ncbi:MAG TPA: 2-C-methyl-D-erythritol 4-phosphate cytidylyltransferase [Candidatus Butyricicoccus stercorigallinarum]|nr:2-C-methyl-D-erythritol 4-phosphate cytidylyltransferase [Candidatus Butyricicoccus stercorigallinarum]